MLDARRARRRSGLGDPIRVDVDTQRDGVIAIPARSSGGMLIAGGSSAVWT
jgi:hypothetical protein